jgi:hypothetical protein
LTLHIGKYECNPVFQNLTSTPTNGHLKSDSKSIVTL